LKDGSRVEMRSHSELSLERATDGIGIRLRTGVVVVNAAQQHDGHLYVHTKDITVAVAGTMFVVNAEESGSRVAVIDGEAQVREGAIEKSLRRGEQVATSPALATRPVKEEFAWSRHANAISEAFARGMAETAAPLVPIAATATSNATAAGGQAASGVSSPEFEAVSVRECDPDHLPETPDGGRGGGANSFRLTPGRLSALCMTLATLIRTAYGYGPIDLDFVNANGSPDGRGLGFGNVYGLGVEDGRRVRGGPDWIRQERYTVNAVASPGTNPDAQTLRGPMLQRVLERRFQLKAHVAVEEVPAFSLIVARGGLKMKPVTMDDCEPPPPGAPRLNGIPVTARPRSFADVRSGQKPSCALGGERNGPNMVVVGGAVPLSGLARLLASRLGGVRVIDKTGVTDRFNFVLEFAVDENAPGLRFPGVAPPPQEAEPAEPSDVPLAATIFSALEDQLGLKLEPAKSGREYIVIDHIEHPSPN
jgi:uncharacterized protein (TIGR03435 family)